MRTTVRTVVTLLFIAIVAGIGLAVLYFGSSTGLVSGGADTVLGGASKALPFYAQVGWIRNTAPWPVTIDSIDTNVAHAALAPTVYLEAKHGSAGAEGSQPIWSKISPRPPYKLVGGSLRYLGFAVMPQAGHVASFNSFTVNFTGPLGLKFHKTFSGTIVAARAAGLPIAVLAADPTIDPTSLDAYVVLLRTALEKHNVAETAIVMGGDATPAEAQALLAHEKGFTSKYQLVTTPLAGGYSDKLVFYRTNPAKDALPPVTVTWAGFRWSAR